MSFDVFLNPIPGVAVDRPRVMVALTEAGVDEPNRILATGEGWRADVYASEPESGMMLNRIDGAKGWDFVIRLAESGPFAVMPVGVGTFVTRTELLDQLHPEMPAPHSVISTGAALHDAVQSLNSEESGDED